MPFRPMDSGPIYVETLRPETTSGNFWIAEPWNTGSNLVFLALLGYWLWRMRKSQDRHFFLSCCLPVLFVGWIGGTLYHGTRSHDLWYVMDYAPIAGLAIATALYLWRKVASWSVAVGVVTSVNVASHVGSFAMGLQGSTEASWGYATLALNVLLPVLLYARNRRWREASWLAASAFLIIVAISFRQADQALAPWMSQGSHFLWHLFGGASVHCLISYLWSVDRRSVLSDATSDLCHATVAMTDRHEKMGA